MPARYIADFFEADHDEVDALMASVDFSRRAEALSRLSEFDRRLERHIEWEERLLFPAAAAAAAHLERGPIAVILAEHRSIREAKAAALHALQKDDVDGAKAAIGRMLEVLGPHNEKEERVLYPACDQLLGEEGAAGILAMIRGGARA